MPTPRGGWPFPNPPNVRFKLNRYSPQANGLVGWWPTIPVKGGILRDFSGFSRNGIITGTDRAISKRGRVLEYNGTSDFVDTNSNLGIDYGTEPFSAGGWFKVDDLTIDDRTIIGWGSGGDDPWMYWMITTDDASDRIRFAAYDGTGSDYLYSPNNSIVINKWYHVFVTQDGTTAKIYIDGKEVASGFVAMASRSDALDEVKIGWPIYVTRGGWFDGLIGDMRVYNYILSPSEVLYQVEKEWELYAPEIPIFYSIPIAAAVNVSNPPKLQPMRIWKGVR